MPLTSSAADAFGVVTICLVALLIILGLLCITYTLYFRNRVHNQSLDHLAYFGGPWLIRIIFILFVIWWGIGEILRLSLLRREGKLFDVLDQKWQETVCKGYIVSNLGFAEPCLFLTLVFLLRASLQRPGSGILSRKWNAKTLVYVLLWCLPVFVLQLLAILIGPQLRKSEVSMRKLPHYFTITATRVRDASDVIALCSYPLLSTLLLGAFTTISVLYLLWLGREVLELVINKVLQRRVYTLLFSVSICLPLRVLFLGLSVLSKPNHLLFEVLAFSSFLALFCCAGVCILLLVYCPIADSLALGKVLDLEARRRVTDDNNEVISLIANQSHLEESSRISPTRNSDASTKQGSISFRAYERDGSSSTVPFVELSLFSPSRDVTPVGSPLVGWPMQPPRQAQGY